MAPTTGEVAVPADVPPEWAAMMRLAARIAPTSFTPKAMRGKAGEVLATFMLGHELGLAPITALRSIHVIDGQPTCSAQLMRALILSKGHRLDWREVSTERVILDARRRDTGSTCRVIWTLDDARRAKLLGKGNWATYPRAMLAARATSETARLLFADLLHGLAYTPDEIAPGEAWPVVDVSSIPAYESGGDLLDDSDEDAEWRAAARGDTDDTEGYE